MGFIDPMTINSAAATGVIDFSGGSVIWLLLVGAFGGIVFASAQSWRPTRRGLPRLATPRLGAELAGRAR